MSLNWQPTEKAHHCNFLKKRGTALPAAKVSTNSSWCFCTMADLTMNAVILSRSRDGTDSYSSADQRKIIVGMDVRGWLSMSCFEYGSNSQNMGSTEDTQCAVCLDSILIGQSASTFDCGHTLHFECADLWMTRCIQNSRPAPCPLCNAVIIAPVFHVPRPVEVAEVGGEIQASGMEQGVIEIQAPLQGGFLRRKIEYLCSRWSLMWTT